MANLETEINKEKDALLSACLKAFNELENMKLESNDYPSTYALASKLDRMVQLIELQSKHE